MSKVLAVIGAVLTINGIFMCILSNLNIGSVLTILFGGMLLVWGLIYNKIKVATSKGAPKVIKYIIIFSVISELVLVGFIAIYGQTDNMNYSEDVVIVLGAGIRGDKVTLPLKRRLDKAIEYHAQNPDALILVTGGQGFQETITEAEAMKRYLVKNGISQNVIVNEEKATSTNENMRYSKAILDARFDGSYDVVVITNNFHIYRAVSIARREGFKNVHRMHAGLEWYNYASCYLRESLAVLKMWVFD